MKITFDDFVKRVDEDRKKEIKGELNMKLTGTQKKRIEDDLAAFTNEYAGKTKEERKEDV